MVWAVFAARLTAPSLSFGTVGTSLAALHDANPEIGHRMQAMQCVLPPVLTDEVQARLYRFLGNERGEVAAMLGRAGCYLPTVEHYLSQFGLPESLKYLPMAESMLLPNTVSEKGAAGLWQLVPGTAGSLGLVISDRLDERFDPARSSEAAAKYLRQLHDRYCSWELALAAYNCGPKRLNSAIAHAGSNSFERVKPFLPLETQRYLARYVAVAYVGQFAELHGIVPALPDALCLGAVSAKVYAPVSLKGIANATGLDLGLLRQLNPSMLRDELPAVPNGVFLALPLHAWEPYLRSMQAPEPRP
jgi:membrane-bound lytic murein transglycosylase D